MEVSGNRVSSVCLCLCNFDIWKLDNWRSEPNDSHKKKGCTWEYIPWKSQNNILSLFQSQEYMSSIFSIWLLCKNCKSLVKLPKYIIGMDSSLSLRLQTKTNDGRIQQNLQTLQKHNRNNNILNKPHLNTSSSQVRRFIALYERTHHIPHTLRSNTTTSATNMFRSTTHGKTTHYHGTGEIVKGVSWTVYREIYRWVLCFEILIKSSIYSPCVFLCVKNLVVVHPVGSELQTIVMASMARGYVPQVRFQGLGLRFPKLEGKRFDSSSRLSIS